MTISPRRHSWLIFLLALILLRIAIAPWGLPNIHRDTLDYDLQSKLPLWSILSAQPQDFYLRPVLPALLFKASGHRQVSGIPQNLNLVVVQVLISALAFAAISLVGRKFCQGAKWIAWTLFWFLVSMDALIFPWDGIALSENLSQNSLILLVAAGLLATSTAPLSRKSAAFIAIAAAICALSRDSNLLLVLLFVPFFVLNRYLSRAAPLRVMGATSWIVLSMLCLTCLYGAWHASRRSTYKSAILVSFVALRLPNDYNLFSIFKREFKPPFPTDKRMKEQYELDRSEMEQWVADRYQPHHFDFLMRHPRSTASLFQRGVFAVMYKYGRGRNQYEYLHNGGYAPQDRRWPTAVSSVAAHLIGAPLKPMISPSGGVLWPLVVLMLILGICWWRAWIRPALFATFLTASFYLQFALCLLTAGVEDYRHCLAGLFCWILLVWLLIVLVLRSFEGNRRLADSLPFRTRKPLEMRFLHQKN